MTEPLTGAAVVDGEHRNHEVVDGMRDALDGVSRMLVGNPQLADEPGVTWSLMQANAQPQQAGAINQFLQALNLEKQVEVHRAAGQKTLVLSAQDQQMLDANGVEYSDVQYTKQDAAQHVIDELQSQSGGTLTAKRNADGTLALDAKGHIQTVKVQQAQQKPDDDGWFDSVGSFFGHLGGAFKEGVWDDALGPAIHKLNQAYNVVADDVAFSTEHLGDVGHAAYDFTTGDPDAAEHRILQMGLDVAGNQIQDMKQQGYDPTSVWSTFAFMASGKAHSDLSSLNQKYGDDKVNQALQFLDDPEKYRTDLLSNPGNYVQDADGNTVLTEGAQARLKYLQSDEFSTLAKQLGAHSTTVGNDLANAIGIDPVKHSTLYGVTAAATNLAASFLIDPANAVFGAVKYAKLARVGIDTLGDADRAAAILTRPTMGVGWTASVQRGWQKGIDLADEIRTAQAAGDTEKVAAATAKFNAELPGLAPLMDRFVGGDHTFLRYAGEELVDGKLVPKAIYGASDGIRSLEDAAEVIHSGSGLLRLMNGRAAVQESLMPGALSAFGFRKLKGAGAAWMTARSFRRSDAAAQDVLSRASADPALAQKLIDDQTLVRLTPHADDAVLPDGTVLAQVAERDPSMLASQDRALALTAKGRGDIAFNLRKTGDPLGEGLGARTFDLGKFGTYSPGSWLQPGAIAARTRLAAQRFTTMLPRNSRLALDDPRAGDTVYKAALMYLNRGDANMLRAAWNAGDHGTRKLIAEGLTDQLGHAAGLTRTERGRDLLAAAKTENQAYSAADSEITVDGQNLALFEGQTRDFWTIPAFRDLQLASAKLGLWEATIGRMYTRQWADSAMASWKLGALFKPSTTTRNQLEGWLNAIVQGRFGPALQARAWLTTPNQELWAKGLDLGSADRAAWQAAKDAGDETLAAQIGKATRLAGQHTGRTRYTQRVADMAPFALAGRAYRGLIGKTMDADHIAALETLGREDLQATLAGYREQVLSSGVLMGHKRAAAEATELSAAGYGSKRIRYAMGETFRDSRAEGVGPKKLYPSWTHEAIDGTEGADRYAAALATRVDSNPETTKMVIGYLRDRTALAEGKRVVDPVTMDDIVAALEKEKRNTAFGRVFAEDDANAANVFRTAVTDEEKAAGKQQWAQKIVDEYTYLLHGQNGKFADDLADHIVEHGTAPDGVWIADHLKGLDRPESVLAPQVMPMAAGGVKGMIQALQDTTGTAYQLLVEGPLQRTTTSPVFLANYAIARKGLNGTVEKMVAESGVSREAAENLARELSIKQAWVKSESMIDDPGQLTQFDVVARNFFPFSRATQAMIRRWSTSLWRNPGAAWKMMLAYDGAQHSGMIYDNPYGEQVFTYPGSALLGQVMHAVSQVPGFGEIAQFPLATSMTGQTLMAVPGADNPFRFGMGPMIAVPLREVYKHILPTAWRDEAQELDSIVNGPIGAGDTAWSSFLLPAGVRKFYQAWNGDDRNSALASAQKSAFANLAATGQIPPTNATPEQLADFRHRLKVQTQNSLYLWAAVGLFAPAAPSTPSQAAPGTGADFAWDTNGVKGLSDEYKEILNETGGDVARANAVWSTLHPDRLIYKLDENGEWQNPVRELPSAYTVQQSRAVAKGAYLPATTAALRWMTMHGDFISKYGDVAAYFLPASTANGEFSDAAYQAQLDLALRVKKTPQEFSDEVYVKHAQDAYYRSTDAYDTEIAQAKAMNNDAEVSALQQSKSAWERQYKDLNPLFANSLNDRGARVNAAYDQLRSLRGMVQSGEAPGGAGQSKALAQIITAYDNLAEFRQVYSGSSKEAVAAREAAVNATNQWAAQHVTQAGLVSVWNGVFRTLDSSLARIATN